MNFKQLCKKLIKSIQQNVRFLMSKNSENIQKGRQEEIKDFQALLYKFKDIQGLSSFEQILDASFSILNGLCQCRYC
jgi:hypothetical protein